MEEVILRFPHLGQQIFESLNDASLQRNKRVKRSWCYFIDNQKTSWIRIIKYYVNKFHEIGSNYIEENKEDFDPDQEIGNSSKFNDSAGNPTLWSKVFQKTRLDLVKHLAVSIHNECEIIFGVCRLFQTLLDFYILFQTCSEGSYRLLRNTVRFFN